MSFTSNTVPNRSMSLENKQEDSPIKFLYLNKEADRLKTFDSWTKDAVDKHSLAKFGFYYKGPDDAVKCIYCDVVIACWDVGDDPLREHIHWSPSCSFLLNKVNANEPIDPNINIELPSHEFVLPILYNDEIIFNQIDTEPNCLNEEIVLTGEAAARHPAYRTLDERLRSFQNWPKSMKQTPQGLSEAGFFYLGKGDQVKCFDCGGALRDFEEDDEPWIEHAKYFDCYYVKQCKGEQFIEHAKSTLQEYEMDEEMDLNSPSSIEDDDDKKIFAKCNICLSEELNIIFLPCMHIYTCAKCGFSFKDCPVCRQKIIELKKCKID